MMPDALVACDITGSYLTEDGGASRHMFKLGGTTRFFEWDPNNAKVIDYRQQQPVSQRRWRQVLESPLPRQPARSRVEEVPSRARNGRAHSPPAAGLPILPVLSWNEAFVIASFRGHKCPLRA